MVNPFSSRCEFAKKCGLYSLDSYTCNHGGGDYCGKYKDLKYGRVQKMKESLSEAAHRRTMETYHEINRHIEEEMLFQQTGKVKKQ
jgi:hypothetical protein